MIPRIGKVEKFLKVQDLKVIPTFRKLNIVDIVFYLSLRCVGIEITVATAFDAVWNMHIERERHS